jgi:hypothetical protein
VLEMVVLPLPPLPETAIRFMLIAP